MNDIEEIKSRLSVTEVISSYIRIEKSGNQYKARCPFHNEKTPSFYISPIRNTYHCFGCGESGDIFQFVSKIEGLDFIDALKVLADRAGISLKKKERNEDNRLISLLETAKIFYMQTLESSIEARKYLHERGLTEETIKEFQIGYTVNDWRKLFINLSENGFTPEEMVESGLVIKTDDGKYYDRFRGRVMFPINNSSGITVGFTGRILPVYDDGKSGKYVNTPETKLYKKSQILFNLDKAKRNLKDVNEIILCEGQMDVIMSHQAGLRNIVAVSGTAFTEEQVKMLKRLVDNVTLAFDNDQAGHKARERASIMCAYGDININVINLDQKDIADVVVRNPKEWLDIYQTKISYINFLANKFLKINELENKISFIKNDVVPYLRAISSPIQRDLMISELARITNINTDSIVSELKKGQIESINHNQSNNDSETNAKPQISITERMDIELNSLYRELVKNHAGEIDNLVKEFNFELNTNIPEEILVKEFLKLERQQLNTLEAFKDMLQRYHKIVSEEKRKKEILKTLGL